MGLASYAYLLRQHGDTADADYYDEANKAFVTYWLNHAAVSKPNQRVVHYRIKECFLFRMEITIDYSTLYLAAGL